MQGNDGWTKSGIENGIAWPFNYMPQWFTSTSRLSLNASCDAEQKELKRAANRRYAQLSRKRKRQRIDELKEENEELRRQEQILRSVPDLIFIFDSSGRISFVSHSVSNFLDFKPIDLEGTSFWQILGDESMKIFKSAFMDTLKTCAPSMNVPLGDGLWELTLKDKDGSEKLVTLNSVLHFSDNNIECVCSIRSERLLRRVYAEEERLSTDCSLSHSGTYAIRIKPQQSVVLRVAKDPLPARDSAQGSSVESKVSSVSEGESLDDLESGSSKISP